MTSAIDTDIQSRRLRRKETVKVGVGFEISMEALQAVLAERFPHFIAWNQVNERVPSLDYAPGIGVIGLYWSWLSDWDIKEDNSDHPVRRVGESAPIPVARITLYNVLLEDGKSRCGWTGEESDDRDKQCKLPLGHQPEHA